MFLRSIHVQLDADHPERILHFQPTSKTVPLVRALAANDGDSAFFVVAPYGSGKSITASYVLQLVEGRPEGAETLEAIEERLDSVSPDLASDTKRRRQGGKRGLTLALHGHHPSVPEAIQEAAVASMRRQKLGREARSVERIEAEDLGDVVNTLDTLRQKAKETGRDRIVILWDEFGRHLESLIAAGRAADLAAIQVLAEYASRARDVPVTLALLLHRDLLQYAGNLPQSVRAEWKKIEGRFRTIQYVDDSREIYRLIGEIVSSRRNGKRMPASKIQAAARQAQDVGLFSGLTRKELVETLRAAYPLEPATLYLLPRLSARVAQNERTLFSFLLSADLDSPVDPAELYDYFSGEMRSDVAAGGTYRQWIETESALSKADGPAEAKALKTACLLSLGLGGERSRTGRAALGAAVAGYGPVEETEDLLEGLVARRLLLHRQHSDQVAVWHGTDFDLRGRLEEEKRRRSAGFDLVGFLSKEVRAPVWRPLKYNDEYLLRRYLAGEYRSARKLRELLEEQSSGSVLPVGCDGRIVYGIVTEAGELKEVTQQVQEELREPRLVVALPQKPVGVTDLALEIACLLELKKDRELLGSDPVVEPELHQMLDDARDHLQRQVDRLVLPGPEGPRWFHRGKELMIRDKRALRRELSRVMKEVFPKTPRINNEMIVKERPTAVLINARKRLLLGILEREGQKDFGILKNGPDASMMRTVLLHTKLFRPGEPQPWAEPKDLEPGLRAVWRELETFLTAPADEPKPFAPFIDRLREPPFGVRQGVLPILFAAGLKAFPSARALLRGEEYVEDILASHVEAIFQASEEHELVVRELSDAEREYLEGFQRLFGADGDSERSAPDIVRTCYDALARWKAELPPGALGTKRVGERAQGLQKVLQSEWKNPMTLLLETTPELVECPVGETRKLLTELRSLREELEGVEGLYRSDAERGVREALRLGGGDEQTLRDAAGRWARCFPEVFVQGVSSGIAKGLIKRCGMPYPDDAKLLESLASLLVGKGFDDWDDVTATEFDRALRARVHEIEDAAISVDATFLGGGEAVEGVAELVQGRIERLMGQLDELVGEERAENMIASLITRNDRRESA